MRVRVDEAGENRDGAQILDITVMLADVRDDAAVDGDPPPRDRRTHDRQDPGCAVRDRQRLSLSGAAGNVPPKGGSYKNAEAPGRRKVASAFRRKDSPRPEAASPRRCARRRASILQAASYRRRRAPWQARAAAAPPARGKTDRRGCRNACC